MQKRRFLYSLFLSVILASALLALPARAEPQPGASCAGHPEGAMMRSGGPELGGAFYIMRCTSNIWEVTAPNPGITPDPFSFTDQTDVAVSTLIESNTVTITGIDAPTSVSISGAGSPQFRIAGSGWVTSGMITNGQTLQLRLTSDSAFSTMRSATVTVGTQSDQWDVTTLAQDTTPDAFDFTDQTGVALSTLTTSNTLTITGITGDVNVSVSGAGSPEIRINGGAWVTSGTIQNGESLEVRLTSDPSFNTMRSATVTVGTASDQWDVTTETACVDVGGYCWYLGASGASCDTACVGNGGCNLTGTRNYAGSGGTNANCTAVLDALSAGGSGMNDLDDQLVGCGVMGSNRFRYMDATTCSATFANYKRACACNN